MGGEKVVVGRSGPGRRWRWWQALSLYPGPLLRVVKPAWVFSVLHPLNIKSPSLFRCRTDQRRPIGAAWVLHELKEHSFPYLRRPDTAPYDTEVTILTPVELWSLGSIELGYESIVANNQHLFVTVGESSS